jgi:hypothetical protein
MATILQQAQQKQFRDKGSLRRAVLILEGLQRRYAEKHLWMQDRITELECNLTYCMKADYNRTLCLHPRKIRSKKDETITTSSKESTTSDRVRRT